MMSKPNIPPGWEKRDTSGKPIWESKKSSEDCDNSTSIDKIQIESDEKERTSIPESQQFSDSSDIIEETECSQETNAKNPDEYTYDKSDFFDSASVIVQKDLSTQENTKSRKSKKLIIILSILLSIVIIVLVVIVFFYFQIQHELEPATVETIPLSTTSIITSESVTSNTTTESTTTSSSSTTETSTVTTTSINEADYIGYWHPENDAESELTIHSISASEVVFSLWFYRIASIEDVSAPLDGSTAFFARDEIAGSLTFKDDAIQVDISSSDIIGIPSRTETDYCVHVDNSVQYGTTEAPTMNPSAEIINFQCTYGKINCHNSIVAGFDTSYVSEGGPTSVVRNNLDDGWNIMTYRCCYNYGILWYECYDSDDGDYYGWIDELYLDFNTSYDDSYYSDNNWTLDETPNVQCPNCLYEFFTTGVGTEGLFCPKCGYNWMP